MSEIEKMYENVGVEKIGIKRCSGIKQGVCQHNCNECESFDYKYPPFTAEKQIELIKWLGIRDELNLYQNKATNDWVFYDHEKDATHYSFEQGLASWINYLWEDLTSEEKQQVKGILE